LAQAIVGRFFLLKKTGGKMMKRRIDPQNQIQEYSDSIYVLDAETEEEAWEWLDECGYDLSKIEFVEIDDALASYFLCKKVYIFHRKSDGEK
jgi:DNA-dependent RNA polymerase auxiliary subunit epsilon